MKERTVDQHLQEKLKDPYFKELYELEQQKFSIVKNIIDYRIKHKLSQTDLAKQLKVTQQHISNIESGEFSSVATLEKVLLGIGMTVRIEAVRLNSQATKRIALALAQQPREAARRLARLGGTQKHLKPVRRHRS